MSAVLPLMRSNGSVVFKWGINESQAMFTGAFHNKKNGD